MSLQDQDKGLARKRLHETGPTLFPDELTSVIATHRLRAVRTQQPHDATEAGLTLLVAGARDRTLMVLSPQPRATASVLA